MITATHRGKYHDVEYSIVNVSELEGDLRIDAEYYEPFYLRNEEKIKKKSWMFLKQCLKGEKIIKPSNFNRIYVEVGIPIIMAQNIREIFLDFSQKFFLNPQNITIKPIYEDILITITGANIGQNVIFLEKSEHYLTTDAAILRINKNIISPYYLVIFLNTTFFKKTITRYLYGAAQPHLSLNDFAYLKIPIPSDTFQKFIEKLVLKAYEERQKAEKLYQQAEETLLEELGLKNWKPKTKKIKIGDKEFEEEENISIRNLSEVIKADRMDAEYWEPKYDDFLNRLRERTNLEPLEKFLISEPLKGVEVGSENYQEEGIPFIRVSNIDKFGIVERDQKYISFELYTELRNRFEPKEGEILLTKDATPGIAYVLKKPLKGIIASGIVRLKIKSIDKEYLALVINSIIGQMQIIKEGGGSVISHWKTSQIKKLLIPLIEPKIQQKISQLIQQSFKARENSETILEIAKKTVEVYIEKDEEEGIKYANYELRESGIKID